MATSLIVRPVAEQDYDQWLPLWLQYNAFYGRSGETALAEDVTTGLWNRFFDAYEPVHALVAELDGELVGITHYLYHRLTIALEPACYLHDLFTSEASRGSGVGRALIEAVYKEAKDAGADRLYWLTHESNDTARKLYDKVAENTGLIHYRKFSAGDK